MDRIGFNLKNVLSKRDAVALIELIHKSLSCSKGEDAQRLIESIRCLIPFKSSISVMSKKGADGAIQLYEPLTVSCHAEYIEESTKKGLVKRDPIVINTFKNFRLQYWEDTLKQHPYPKDVASLLLDCEQYEAINGHGYNHGVRNLKKSEGSLFSFYGLKRDKRTELILHLLVPHLHEALARIINLSRSYPDLSQKEIEVLKWLAQGKCGWDISRILGISENTVRFHIGNVKKKLDAVSSAHAVAIAVKEGVIDVE